MMRYLQHATLIVALTVLAAGCKPQQEAQRVAFVDYLGVDTLAVEVFTRQPDRIEGDVLVRSPATRVAHYVGALDDEGNVTALSVDWSTPAENPGGAAPQHVSITVDGDSATVVREGGSNAGTQRVAASGFTIPLVNKVPIGSVGIFEQAVRRAHKAAGDSFAVNVLSANRNLAAPNALVRQDDGSMRWDFFGDPLTIQVGDDGTVRGYSGAQTTMKVEGKRIDQPAFDIGTMAARFARLDAQGAGMGVASPQGTVETTVDGAAITIVYSRPAKRGREIWGGLVPYGQVWRTGANAATSFSTDHDLMMGETVVPAGEYTLYSVFSDDTADLIVNGETGQWGTEYHQEQDVARIPMEREAREEPVERFTIDVVPSEDGGGRLSLTWDTTTFFVPIRVASM